jgi:hypothetical protein
VVCSRLRDYEELAAKLNLSQAIALKQLTRSQVERYFERLQTNQPPRRLTDLFNRLWQDEALRELIKTPLMLNIITVTYAHAEAPLLPQGEGRQLQNQILDAYTQRMFNRVGRTQIKLLHPPAEMVRYLSYLAAKLGYHNWSRFSIGQMRYSWLEYTLVDRYLQLKRLSLWLIGGLSGGVAFGVMGTWIGGLGVGLPGGLLSGLGVGWGISQLAGSTETSPAEKLTWTPQSAQEMVIFGLMFGLLGAMGLGIPGWLTNGLHGGLLGSLMGGLGLGLIAVFGFGLNPSTVDHQTKPGRALSRSRRSALLGTLLIGLIGGLSFAPLGGPAGGLWFGLSLGLLGGLHYGGRFLIEHYLRLYLLNKHNLLPFQLISFLDQATELIFLQRLGGNYRFIHRSVQEYFAAQRQPITVKGRIQSHNPNTPNR